MATKSSPVVHLDSYDRIIVCFSGGKDSLACLLYLLEQGVSPDRITLHHHLVDGREGSTMMDWPVTEAYCQAIAKAFGIPISFSWRVGGMEREMLRNDASTAPVAIPAGGGHALIGGDGPRGTRLKFPQLSASLTTRWCSAYLKIDVFARYLCNEAQFQNSRTLVLTGERAEESASRANYKMFEPHRADRRDSERLGRHIDHYRPVHAWTENEVWEIIEGWQVVAHPAYHLGWGRVSCRQCIFGSKHQWATVRALAPEAFDNIAQHEREFKVTIHRSMPVTALADAGTPYTTDPYWVELANSTSFDMPVFTDRWTLPQGAYGESCGPT